MLDLIYLESLSYFIFSHINIFKIGLEIHGKLWVEWTKLQICQMKSDINWKCYHYTRNWKVFLESKTTKLQTKKKNPESKTVVSRKKISETDTET